MYQEPLFLQPAFQERIWGGQKLTEEFGYQIPYEHTGEAWVISAHPNGPSVIENGPLKGKTLKEAWEQHGELFNKKTTNDGEYPLLIKLLDADDNLSVQVHPDDTYASDKEGVPYGKTECWYVVSAEPDSELIIGHHAQTREELERLMNEGKWDELLKRVPVKAGDFVHVPSGTIHAIGRGIVILETQQSSDITYRVYDYDRKDDQGNKRELHLEKAVQVTTVPDEREAIIEMPVTADKDLYIKRLVEDPYFTVEHWELRGTRQKELQVDFLQVSVLDGKGTITVNEKTFTIEKGTNFVLPHTITSYELNGDLKCIVSWV